MKKNVNDTHTHTHIEYTFYELKKLFIKNKTNINKNGKREFIS